MRKEEKDREKEKKPVNLIRKIALLLLLTAPVLSVFWVGGVCGGNMLRRCMTE